MASLNVLFADLISEDESRAEAAACGLAQLGETVFPTLGLLLQSSIVDQRWWAIRTLAQMREPPLNWLIIALDDPSCEVREAAALAISAHPSENAVPGLIRALSDTEGMLGTLAMNALTEIGKPAIPALLEAYQSAQPKARIQIMRTMAEIQDQRAISLILKATDEDSAMLNYWAVEGIERLGLNMVYIKPE
jgi:HEAT repeat protein